MDNHKDDVYFIHKAIENIDCIIHDYGVTDYRIVYEIISKDIYDLKKEMSNS